jgi:hypothetical protein|tara:strand:- start:633 stop:902 length:270 start_codon:yes stop_codon:yes gene_type:complete
VKTTNENATRRKLIVLSQWLKDYSNNCYDSNEGVVESQVRVGVNTALNQIGDYLDEIMFMSNEQIDTELGGGELTRKTMVYYQKRNKTL